MHSEVADEFFISRCEESTSTRKVSVPCIKKKRSHFAFLVQEISIRSACPFRQTHHRNVLERLTFYPIFLQKTLALVAFTLLFRKISTVEGSSWPGLDEKAARGRFRWTHHSWPAPAERSQAANDALPELTAKILVADTSFLTPLFHQSSDSQTKPKQRLFSHFSRAFHLCW